MRRKLLIVLFGALLLAGVEAPPSARAAWTSPVTLSSQDAGSPRVAIDAQGDAVFVWRCFDGTEYRIQTRSRAVDGTLSPIRMLSAVGQDASGPSVAVDSATGNAVFVWRRFDGANYRIQARSLSVQGALGSVRAISAAGHDAGSANVALDAAGNAVFVFDDASAGIQTRTLRTDGTLTAIQTLSPAGRDPALAVNGQGRAAFVWTHTTRIEARVRLASGTLAPIQAITPPGSGSSGGPQVGLDASGRATFAWRVWPSPYLTRARTRTRSATGTLSQVTTLAEIDLRHTTTAQRQTRH